MSNRVTVQATVFKNHPQGLETFGYRMFDDYDQTYDNTFDAVPDNDLELLRHALANCDGIAGSMLEYVEENNTGIYIGDTWYDWDEIRHLWNEDRRNEVKSYG